MAKRGVVMLMAVTALGGVASADTWPAQVAIAPKAAAKKLVERAAVKPRLLPTGAPACGNVMLKSYQPEDVWCPVIENMWEIAELGRKHAVEQATLTVEPAPRPQR